MRFPFKYRYNNIVDAYNNNYSILARVLVTVRTIYEYVLSTYRWLRNVMQFNSLRTRRIDSEPHNICIIATVRPV